MPVLQKRRFILPGSPKYPGRLPSGAVVTTSAGRRLDAGCNNR